MVVLIDTNVLLDFLLGRDPYFGNADRIIKLCAGKVKADYIVTRNMKDFEISEIPAILPEDFLKLVQH